MHGARDGERNGKARALFVCTHNSARSQMAEGLLRHLAGDRFEAFSAGTEATCVRSEAISAMNDLRIDISGRESKTLDRYLGEPFDYVITVCDEANEACPFFPGAKEPCTGRCRIRPGPTAPTRSVWCSFGW